MPPRSPRMLAVLSPRKRPTGSQSAGPVVSSDVQNLVGAPRFELGTSCAQASEAISWKSFLFNLVFENKRVRKIFGDGNMYGNVAPHA
jgi:hypothetical protein